MTKKQNAVKVYGVLSEITLAKPQPKPAAEANSKSRETDLDSGWEVK